MSLNAPYTPNTVIQSTQVSNDLVGLANGTNDTTNNSMATYRSESIFDYVASGIVWSGDSYGGTRNGSQTSGVVYIAGVRLAVSAVSAHLFTASKDTYIDINGSGVQVYTEVTNNAASPALTAGSFRSGIIITGATTIASAGSVNQGQHDKVLPIASSIPYSVTDSLGNLISNLDINRKVLGYRQITSDFSTASGVDIQVTGLSVPVILPAGRRCRARFVSPRVSNSTLANTTMKLWDGVVSSGTAIQTGVLWTSSSANGGAAQALEIPVYSATQVSKTYNVSMAASGGTTAVSGTSGASFVEIRLD